MIKTRRRYALPIGLLLAAPLAGCSGDVVLPDEGEAAKLEIVSGNEQLGPAGTTLPQQVVVRVLDTRERPVANQDVTFTIGSGGGTVTPATVKSNGAGQAAASWTLGPSSGSHLLRVQTARGGSGTLEVSVRAIAVAGSGSVLVGAGGNDQTGPVSSALADSLVVRATDALGNPVADVEVTWSVSGGGSIDPTTVVTGADGLAAAERVLGPTAGGQSAQASVNGFTGSPVTFSHTAVPANPTALVKISGDDQTAPGGFEVAEDLVVRLEDDNGNGIGGRAIAWVVDAGSGSVNPVNATTDVNGLATTRWTLPSAVGNYGVSAVFSGLPPVPFTGTATADVPTTIELVSGNNQSAAVGATLPNPLVVRVTDANDIPVANVGVTWTAVDGGSVSAANTATDASGLAQVTRTLGLLPQQYTTTAEVGGLTGSPITFTSTATVGPAAKLAIITQPGTTTATSGQALVPQPEIEVQDALGNPVLQPVRTVSASITSSPEDPTGPGSATLAGANDQTNASGRTTYTGLRITGPSGSYVLTFNSGALIPVSSTTITLGTGSASKIVMQQQPSATAASGAVIAQAPIVRVEDAAGNPVAGNRNILVDIESGTGVLSGTTTVNTSGGATATFNDLRITGAAGPHTLLFSSAGLTSVESGVIEITAATTTTSLSAEPASSVQGDAVTFTANVTSGGGMPTGQVSFRDDGNEMGQGVLAGGVATFETTALTAGTHPITAHYLGDGNFGTSASGTLDYSVAAGNVAPSAQADAFNVDEDATLSIAADGVLGNDDDADGDDLTAQLVAEPTHAQSFALNSNGSFTYTPEPDFNGEDFFTYRANDGQTNSNIATVTITVIPVNDDPGFVAAGDVSTSSLISSILGGSHAGWASGISPGPPDEGGQTEEFEVSIDNDEPFQTTPLIDAAGNLTYRPFLRFDTIVVTATVVAEDSDGATSDPQTFTITINP